MFSRSITGTGGLTTALACALAATLPTSAAFAQTYDEPNNYTVVEPGAYAVLRAGPQIDADLHMKGADATAPSTFPKDADFKTGLVGEIGLGYNLAGFRVEGTVGYDTAGANLDRLASSRMAASGRLKTLSLGVSGYYDLSLGNGLRPYIGGGIGAARTSVRLARISAEAPTAGIGSTMKDSDWGFRWHLDAGVGFALSPTTALEIGARYAKVSGLRIDGTMPNIAGRALPWEYKPRATSTALLIGLRHKL